MSLPLGMHVLTLAGLVNLAAGLLLHIVGLATPYWAVVKILEDFHSGLFSSCGLGHCNTYGDQITSRLRACQAFAIIGMLLAFVSLSVTGIHIFKQRSGQDTLAKPMLFVALGAAVTAGASTLLCVIIWASDFDTDVVKYSYSFALSTVGGIDFVFGGVLVFLGSRRTISYNNV